MSQVRLVQKVKKLSLSKPTGFSGRHPFGFLNISQFLSAFNDNLFKFLTMFLLIDIKGAAASNDILFFIGVAFVLPFLLFSSSAGVLADRFSKQKMIVFTKLLEVMIISLAFFVYAHQLVWGCYGLVFLLSLQSALLSPSKYSIVPELVQREHIPKANGLLTSFTYLAVISGTGIATLLTDITGKNFQISLLVCLAAAIIGLITSLYIPSTSGTKSKAKVFHVNVLTQVYRTMKLCKRTPKLRLAVLGSAFFMFIGGYLQLNIIPFAMDFLQMTETGGGWLFFFTSIGIALGALIGGRACRKEVDLGLSCFSLFFLSLMLYGLVASANNLPLALFSLVGLGFFGGMYIVPLDSYIQAFSPSEQRGQVVAASAFLSFFCLLLAPLALYLFGSLLNASSKTGFMFVGLFVLVVFAVLVKYLATHFFHFLSKRILQTFYDLHFINYPYGAGHQEDQVGVVLGKYSLLHLALLLGEHSKMHLFFIRSQTSRMDKLLNFFTGIDVLYAEPGKPLNPALVQKKIEGLPSAIKPIFVFLDERAQVQCIHRGYFESLIEDYHYQIKKVVLKSRTHFKPDWGRPLQYTQLTFHFKEWGSSVKQLKAERHFVHFGP